MKIARGQRIAKPTPEIIRLMLKALDSAEYFLTRITDKPEVIAASNAKAVPSMTSHEGDRGIKANLRNGWNLA
jgi:hypothetical protein